MLLQYFYSKASQYLKLIDPRGAKSEAELFTHPLYDVAKISHSVQGGYDFINNGKFDITVDRGLYARLKIDSPSLGWAADMFQRQLEKSGFDSRLTRLYEASLFISMLPCTWIGRARFWLLRSKRLISWPAYQSRMPRQ